MAPLSSLFCLTPPSREQKGKDMATAEEFDELLALYETAQDPKKKKEYLEKMKRNVLERNGNNDVFITLHTNKTIHISQAELSELIEISRNLEEIKRQKQREILNDEERNRELKQNEYSKDHPYPDFNNPVNK